MTQILSPTWVQPTYSPVYIPTLPSLDLTEDERSMISRLQLKAFRHRYAMLLSEAYYQGAQVITSLGIALPPELEGIRVIVGWPRIAVDPYVERLAVDSFRLAKSNTADPMLDDLRQATDMAAEESLAFNEALVSGRAYWLVGSSDDDGDGSDGGAPEISVESALNIACDWNVRTRKPDAALQSYYIDDRRAAVLYLPDQTIYLAQDDNATWQLVNRDVHNFGVVPVIRMANRPRAAARDGMSEITPELMSITDAACRTLLNLTAASEFYSVPQKLILGATEEDFRASDGSPKSAWETYIGRVLALQRDSDGALPEVKQFDAYDPSVFTTVLEMYASQAAGILGAPPQDLGLYTQGNPVSAEAAQVSEERRDRRCLRMQANFGSAEVETVQMALRFMNNGTLPKGYDNLAADWRDPRIVNFTGYADGMTKLMAEGAVPSGSDVALRKLGFNAVERRQMAEDRTKDPALAMIDAMGHSVYAKAIRMANALIAAASPTQAAGPDAAAIPPDSAAPGAAPAAPAAPAGKPGPTKTPPK